MTDLKKTPLYDWHAARKAKIAPFAGWEMPIQYTSIIAEHEQTRTRAGLFDICHMGEFLVSGRDASAALSRVVTQNLATLAPGRCRYGFVLNERGGVLDDCIVYCLDETQYMIVCNGSRVDVIGAWLQDKLPTDGASRAEPDGAVDVADISDGTAKIDLQGPLSLDVLQDALGMQFTDLKYFGFKQVEFENEPLLVSRTGYTGELGFELYIAPEKALPLWEKLEDDVRVEPCGLGARDTLRLEVGLPLYGHELDEDHTPAEAGYGAMLTSEADYIGKDHVGEVREKLIGLALEGRRSCRHGDILLSADGEEVGRITSGSYCPSIGHAAALAYVQADKAEASGFKVKTVRAELPTQRVDLPFYTEGTARKKLG
ncbi:glycine cleavage system aminomethyltransferase GcvT [Oceanidesulfovibrio indonesiensis]|uniref:aminomethyltransferase n=1 Tax=Oceanidesulfovibrio indonesiensis TaxID=54767 RepID=A0A7M3MBR8_9BACT|nr:glycine cleavage system aminomethyltransferase GcvT [Oceanidesulfovibrio indonesiensis]TVM15669.1 glycine cleavage system aminomethyltransferase GcvT [Oceanidesulfovibrio indonesiensis]